MFLVANLLIIETLMIMFGIAVLIIVISNFFKIPHIIAYLITGIVLSPNTSGLLGEFEEVEILSEIGIILLLLTIGMEFSFANLKRLKKYLIRGGLLQVGLTILFVALFNYITGYNLPQSIFWGFLVSLSSTAIVLKLLQDKMQINTDHGKIILAMLLFQDIAVVLLVLFVPILSGSDLNVWTSLGMMLVKFGALALVSIILARFIIPRFLKGIMKMNNQEVFLIATIFMVTGIIFLTSWMGLSPALGAFIAGLIIAETDYNRLAISCFLPFRHVFISFFFISMGMLLDYQVLIDFAPRIAFYLGVIYILKYLSGLIAGYSLARKFQVASMVSLALLQVGEFSFVLADTGFTAGIINSRDYQVFIAVSIITMMLSPMFITRGKPISSFLYNLWPGRVQKKMVSD